MIYIENEGALFRGPSRGLPQEVWSVRKGCFVEYAFADQAKPVDWGHVIDEGEARAMMIADPKRIPSPEERPDLYDGYDCSGREPTEAEVRKLIERAPPEIRERAAKWAEERAKLEAEAAAKASQPKE